MTIRKSTLNDLPRIEEIYAHAREEMKKNNNPHQWKNSSPLTEEIVYDIESGNHYILENNRRICGVFSLIPGKDPTYSYIEGNWINDLPYLTIHKIASDNTVKGVLKAAFDYAFSRIDTVRIDTHEDNSIMRHLLDKYGFTYCGIIYLKNGEPRRAYQKTIINNKE